MTHMQNGLGKFYNYQVQPWLLLRCVKRHTLTDYKAGASLFSLYYSCFHQYCLQIFQTAHIQLYILSPKHSKSYNFIFSRKETEVQKYVLAQGPYVWSRITLAAKISLHPMMPNCRKQNVKAAWTEISRLCTEADSWTHGIIERTASVIC